MAVQLHSIKGYNSFRKIYDVGMRFRSNNASATVVFAGFSGTIKPTVGISNSENSIEKNNESNSETYCDECKHIIYYGVTVSKKVAKKAVIRNRIKRLMRESLRIVAKEIEIKKLLPIEKIIISYYSAPKHPMQISLKNVLPAVKSLLKQAYLHYEGMNENNNSKDCNISNNRI